MGAARGVKALIKRTAVGKLVRAKKYTCYRAIGPSGRPVGPKLRGVARRLADVVWSTGTIPMPASAGFRGTTWRGAGGGLRRGKAVDAQVSRLAKASARTRLGARMLKLTRLTFVALQHHGLTPIEAQRVVIDRRRNLGTAIDVVCQRGASELVLVELKSGYGGDRATPAQRPGKGTCALPKHPPAQAASKRPQAACSLNLS